jgi:regulatory protein
LKNRATIKKRRANSWAASSAQEKSPKSDKAYNSLVRLLSRRDYSELELTQKLNRWYTPEAVAAALLKAQERKWLKEPAVLSASYSEILHRKGKGHSALNRELKKRGLPAVDRNNEREIEKAKALLAKKFPRKAKLDIKERQKAYRLLAYRGFDSDTIRMAIKSVGTECANDIELGEHENF